MKVRNKVTVILIVPIIIFIFCSNLLFRNFFKNYLINQETSLNNAVIRSTQSYLNEKETKYQGNANDWGHWDDTNNFVKDNNDNSQAHIEYINGNLNLDAFNNLDVNFIILTDQEHSIKYKQYCDLGTQKYVPFPAGFEQGVKEIIRLVQTKEDTSNILQIGDQFYFVATSNITDSVISQPSVGLLLIGRQIGEDIINILEETTNSKVSLSTLDYNNADNPHSTKIPADITATADATNINFVIPGLESTNSAVKLTLTKARDLVLEGNNQVNMFLLYYMHVMVIIAILAFLLLGRLISKPFDRLITDVKALELGNLNLNRLKTRGKDEFSFLRESINNMLGKIELEQAKVKENEDKLYSTLISVGDGVIAVDKDSRITLINPVAQQLTGWTEKESAGVEIEAVYNIINDNTKKKVASPIKKVFDTGNIIQPANHTLLLAKDGSEISIEDTAAPIKDKYGRIMGAVLVFRDRTEKIQRQKQIEYLSYHDQLTGLYNRRFFEEELTRFDTTRNLPFSFVFADVNGLKTINDAFGHQCGDELLKKAAEVFQTACRADDIIARTGGDEFIILMPNTDADSAQKIVHRLISNIEKETVMHVNMSISIGWDTKTSEKQSALAIMKNAEGLMYQKKIFESNSKRSAVVKSILNTLHLKSPRENAHSQRVSSLCEMIGRAYNLSEYDLMELKIAGELHDIGKIAIDEIILNKPGKLTDAEWVEIRKHPETGYRLLSTSNEFYNIAEYVFAHHEKWDGTGYPKGLQGDSISWKARVVAIADAFDAMTSERSYRKKLSPEEAVEEIEKNAGIRFDPSIVKVFVEKVLKMGDTAENQNGI